MRMVYNMMEDKTNSPYIILVVEDDEALSVLIQKKLQKTGFRTESVLNGAQAIAWAVDNPSSLMLMDYKLPDMSGKHIIEALSDRQCNIPFIIMTGYGDERVAVEMLKLGAKDYLVKDAGFLNLLPTVVKRVIEHLTAEKILAEAEERLQRDKELYGNIIESMSDGILALDRHFFFTHWSNVMERIFKFPREELIGTTKRPWDVFPYLVEHGVDVMMRQAMSGEVIEQENIPYYLSDGTRGFTSNIFLPLRTASGKICGIVGVVREVTEHKKAEEQILKLSCAVEQSPSTVIITDTKGNIEYVNPKFTQLTGYTSEDVLGKNPRILKSSETSKEKYKQLWGTIKSGKVWRGELHNRKKNGEHYWELASISPIKNNKDTITHFIAVKEDITERKIMENQLVQAQKSEAIGQLAAGIAHEINTPTQYILSNIHFLRDSFSSICKLLEKYSHMLEVIKAGSVTPELLTEVEVMAKEAAVGYLIEETPKAIEQSQEGLNRVSEIVSAMKTFSHPGNVEKITVDINEAIKSTITVARNEWKYVADIETYFDPNLPPVPCFPGELNQVILNIIINAAHAIDEVSDKGNGGKGIIRISTRCDRDWAELRISDTGAGIPEDIRSRLFDPFFTTKEVGKGTGQGLAIAHSVVVRKHNGTITLDTEIGRGTTFIIRLPLFPNTIEKGRIS